MADDVRDVVAADVLQDLPQHRREHHAREQIARLDLVRAQEPERGEEQQQVRRQREQDPAEHRRSSPAVCAVT